ncbi:MAG: RNA polymerase sigma-70 factor [Tannerellaceae bacterium]
MKEQTLLMGLSSGDAKSFDAIFMLYFPKLKLFLSGFLSNQADAEDLAQDVFMKLWQSRQSLAYVENINAYLYQMARNTLYTYLERSYFPDTLSETNAYPIPSVDEVEELLFAKDLEEQIDGAVEKMPMQRKTIFCMSRKQGMSNEEIAVELNISKRTVETHISAALSDLRKVIYLFLLFF